MEISRIIGLDVGERRIGVAISAPGERLAIPLKVVERQREPLDIEAIAAIAREEHVRTIVVGHPLSLDGTAGPQARRVEGFARRLKKATGVALEYWDERFSTVQASRSARGSKRHRPVDDVAAAIILQAYLDHLQSNP